MWKGTVQARAWEVWESLVSQALPAASVVVAVSGPASKPCRLVCIRVWAHTDADSLLTRSRDLRPLLYDSGGRCWERFVESMDRS